MQLTRHIPSTRFTAGDAKRALGRIVAVVKSEPVTIVAAICALASVIATWGVISPAEYAAAIDMRTIILLFCLMAVVEGLREQGVLWRLAIVVVSHVKGARSLSAALVGLCFATSMVVTNDVSLIVFVPFALMALGMAGQSKLAARVVVLQAVAANLGSSLSPIGNPQNIYLQSAYGLDLQTFFATLAPYVAVGAAGVTALVLALPKAKVDPPALTYDEEPQGFARNIAVLSALLVCCLLCCARIIPPAILLAIVVCALVAFRPLRSLFARVDYGLLLTFFFIFIFVAGLQQIPFVSEAVRSLAGAHPLAAGVCASQVISNVPAAVFLSGFTSNGTQLLAGVNIGGLGTPIASLASLIAIKLYAGISNARIGRFVAYFLVVNFGLLAVLCGFAFMLGL